MTRDQGERRHGNRGWARLHVGFFVVTGPLTGVSMSRVAAYVTPRRVPSSSLPAHLTRRPFIAPSVALSLISSSRRRPGWRSPPRGGRPSVDHPGLRRVGDEGGEHSPTLRPSLPFRASLRSASHTRDEHTEGTRDERSFTLRSLLAPRYSRFLSSSPPYTRLSSHPKGSSHEGDDGEGNMEPRSERHETRDRDTGERRVRFMSSPSPYRSPEGLGERSERGPNRTERGERRTRKRPDERYE